jgi:hypothetical protein
MSVQTSTPTTFTSVYPFYVSDGNVIANYQRALVETRPVNVNASELSCTPSLYDLVFPSNNKYNYYYNESDLVFMLSKKKC